MSAISRALLIGIGLALVLVAAACGGDDETSRATPTTRATSTTSSIPVTNSSTTSTRTPEPTGGVTQELFLTIDDPKPGQVVDEEWYDFRGMTLPGATVIADGDIVVPVSATGAWHIRLRLVPGSNPVTIEAMDASGGSVVEQVQVFFEVPGGDDPPIFSP